MPTDTTHTPIPSFSGHPPRSIEDQRHATATWFVLRAALWSLGLFGLLRLSWIEAQLVLPFARVQGTLGAGLFGAPALPVETTLACSGADALALCLGAILAYPVKWRTRVAGAAGGALLILALNTLRIGTLGRAAAAPVWFNLLHVYLWPALLTLAIAGYVFAWMQRAETSGPPSTAAPAATAPQPSRRFIALTAAFLLAFVAASPFYLESRAILVLAGFVARAAAVLLGTIGLNAHAAANVLYTPRGGFLVSQECIATPLIPVFLAAVCAYSTSWRRVVAGFAATLPLFIALGIVRLLLVALPAVVASPMFFVHAFYQLLLGVVVVFLAALWRHGGRAAAGYTLAGVIVAVLFVGVLGPTYTRVVLSQTGRSLDDPQGAIALLPAFQIGLYLALWTAAFVDAGWRRFVIGFGALALTQTAGVFALHALASSGLTAHVRDVRAWAVAGPVLIFAALVKSVRPDR